MPADKPTVDWGRKDGSAVEPRRGRRALVLGVLVASAILLAAGIYIELRPPSAWPSQVTVEGTVTLSSGNTPLAVVFAGGGLGYTSQVTNGTYSVKLPNRQVYNITVDLVVDQTHRGGTCFLGEFALDSRQEVLLFNITGC